MQQVFGDDSMRLKQIMEWYNQFKSYRSSVENDQRCGRSQNPRNAAVVEEVENLMMKHRCLIIGETAEHVENSTGSTQAILCDEQSGCKICSQASVDGTERTPSYSCTGPNRHYQR
ncbi:hypothetical protein TNCV_4886051 [Trichonephila clavipes]|uniref:Uncharacterized protein n=1 Tax=Trichonephila clavipes TaxID=2585209 RepID=A0A8X6RNB9_TRICX|nr:hypothetical protein TNCV_4886051 [Trichonephila clavipes]